MSTTPLLSVLLPCRNEDETIGACIENIQRTLHESQINAEIVVANSSDDASEPIAKKLGARVVNVQEKGYGRAIKVGLSTITTPYVVMGDADGSYDFSAIPMLLEQLKRGHDLVIANRFKGGVEEGAMLLSHRIGNRIFTIIGSILLLKPIGDLHSGLRAFRREAIEQLNIKSNDMRYDTEMVARAVAAGLDMAEVPTTLRHDGRHKHGSYLRTWRDGWLCLGVLLDVALRRIFRTLA